MNLCEVVDDLVEAACHKVAELHLDHGLLAGNRQPEPCTHNGRFAQRGVSDAAFAELVHESVGDFEHTAIGADVLPHEHEVGMAFHAGPQSLGDGVDEPQFPAVGLRDRL